MQMKFVLPATLLIGCFSLLFALMAAFMFYVDWVGQSPLQVTTPPTRFAESVATAQDFASLQRGCHALAQVVDSCFASSRAQFTQLRDLAGGVALFSLVWGLVCGVTLLYVHFFLRRVTRTHGH